MDMRTTVMVAAGLVSLSSCAPPVPAKDEHATLVAKARAARELREAEMVAKHKREAEPDDSYERRERDHKAAFKREKEERERKQLEACAMSRDERMRELADYLKRRQRVEELQAWESEHCKIVDKSKPVVRKVQDSNGEYHWIEGRDRGVDRVCNATPPAAIRQTWANHLSPGFAPDNPAECRAADIEASPIAAEYWGDE